MNNKVLKNVVCSLRRYSYSFRLKWDGERVEFDERWGEGAGKISKVLYLNLL